ncbi:hypothetical protein [Raineyella sp. W15-4]|uniref:hypothetical protein n=1 Tax=Raineyella sp. W15-4 TaxID=3081651 RepID=UPI00295410D4|nr:hypothetical protein [Raineyella sp. W15-4]WOQ15631.1 hypothetical protein R0145_10305 [Raineyella sp. W15-4]
MMVTPDSRRYKDACRELVAELVAELSAAGMSTRAIAPIIGVSQKQVRNDQQAAGEYQVLTSPAPTPVADPAPSPWTSATDALAAIEADDLDDEPEGSRRREGWASDAHPRCGIPQSSRVRRGIGNRHRGR